MPALVIAHLVAALALPLLGRWSTRAAFVLAAALPAAALGWALAHAGAVFGGQPPASSFLWASVLELEFAFRLDPLGFLMTLLVSGIGTLVLLYSQAYFGAGSPDAKRSAPLLLAFAGVMLGLVLADDLITLYVFWELTTICSFLLVGQAGVSRESRRSAMQALMITTLGGLAMLVGFIVLGEAAGTYRISELAAHPPSGPAVVVAAALILVGAFTKSAQVPFHNWLPVAMVAPTPISAYLHAASMVKAGVFLVARLAPVFAGLAAWTASTAVVGLITMLVGGWRALHETDLKRLLAYGTVSQLGFLMVLAGAGTPVAAIAAGAMLLAHGTFKAALFLVVGIVDHHAGPRDIRELSGLGRRMPWLAATALLASASMAGLPPMVGFLGKEAAFEAFLHGGAGDTAVAVGLVVGSVLTVAYSVRLMWGAFATKRGGVVTHAAPATAGLLLPAALPALAGLGLGVAYPVTDVLVGAYAEVLGSAPYHLALWHGVSLPLLCTVIAVVAGPAVHATSGSLGRIRRRLPKPVDAQRAYERTMGALERVAVTVTGRTQVGSLPAYLGTILLTVLLVPGSVLLFQTTPIDPLRPWDRLLQVPLALVVLIAAVGVVRANRRLTAVLLVGVIGYGIGGMFVVTGGPDLALTQFLVETLTLVAFVFVLRRLPAQFTRSETATGFRAIKMLIAGAGGVFIAFAALIFTSARETPSQVGRRYIALAEEGTGATNVVNAIIIDFRAFDTVGELSVLAVAATGVASLVLTSRSARRRRRGRDRTGTGEQAVPPGAHPAGRRRGSDESNRQEVRE